MKGLALEYPFIILIAVFVILISVSLLISIFKPEIIPNIDFDGDVKYACSKYNNSEINSEELEVVLYGFLKGQCNNFSAFLKESLSFEDLKRMIKRIDKSVEVFEVSKCEFSITSTHSVYVYNPPFEVGKKISIFRKEVDKSDVLVCG